MSTEVVSNDNKDPDFILAEPNIGDIENDPRGIFQLTDDEKKEIDDSNSIRYLNRRKHLIKTLQYKINNCVPGESKYCCSVHIFVYRTNAIEIIGSEKFKNIVKNTLIKLNKTDTTQDIRWILIMYDLMFPDDKNDF